MNIIKSIILGSAVLFSSNVLAQDEIGYYDAPYTRYEADQGTLGKNTKILPISYNHEDLQSEASEKVCVDMTKKGASVEWDIEKPGDGLVVRYSVPDGESGEFDVLVDGKSVGTLELTSKWSWEYLTKNGNENNVGVRDDSPKFRFDEVRMKLPSKVAEGGKLKLVTKKGAIHIDFAELEPVPEAIQPASDDLVYEGDGSDLQVFIDTKGGGKHIFLPPGKYNVNRELYFGVAGTQLKGAGMWHTQINFTSEIYLKGGLRANAKDISFMDLYLTTDRNSRSSSYKGINGVFTSGSVVKNIWAIHFECGAWIAQYNIGNIEYADGFTVSHCRFRNNYADGINLCKGTRNAVVEHCSFRNNGDDDQAIWCADGLECINNEFRYNTSENTWRSSGLAVYGGKNNRAHHILIKDNLEAGIKVSNNYPGVGFNDEGEHVFSDIKIYRCGTFNDLFYNMVGAIDLMSRTIAGNQVKNVRFSNIYIKDACDNGIFINGADGKGFKNLVFENVTVNGTGREFPYNNADEKDWLRGWGLLFASNPGGNGTFCKLKFKNIGGSAAEQENPVNDYGKGSFEWTKVKDCTNNQ